MVGVFYIRCICDDRQDCLILLHLENSAYPTLEISFKSLCLGGIFNVAPSNERVIQKESIDGNLGLSNLMGSFACNRFPL